MAETDALPPSDPYVIYQLRKPSQRGTAVIPRLVPNTHPPSFSPANYRFSRVWQANEAPLSPSGVLNAPRSFEYTPSVGSDSSFWSDSSSWISGISSLPTAPSEIRSPLLHPTHHKSPLASNFFDHPLPQKPSFRYPPALSESVSEDAIVDDLLSEANTRAAPANILAHTNPSERTRPAMPRSTSRRSPETTSRSLHVAPRPLPALTRKRRSLWQWLFCSDVTAASTAASITRSPISKSATKPRDRVSTADRRFEAAAAPQPRKRSPSFQMRRGRPSAEQRAPRSASWSFLPTFLSRSKQSQPQQSRAHASKRSSGKYHPTTNSKEKRHDTRSRSVPQQKPKTAASAAANAITSLFPSLKRSTTRNAPPPQRRHFQSQHHRQHPHDRPRPTHRQQQHPQAHSTPSSSRKSSAAASPVLQSPANQPIPHHSPMRQSPVPQSPIHQSPVHHSLPVRLSPPVRDSPPVRQSPPVRHSPTPPRVVTATSRMQQHASLPTAPSPDHPTTSRVSSDLSANSQNVRPKAPNYPPPAAFDPAAQTVSSDVSSHLSASPDPTLYAKTTKPIPPQPRRTLNPHLNIVQRSLHQGATSPPATANPTLLNPFAASTPSVPDDPVKRAMEKNLARSQAVGPLSYLSSTIRQPREDDACSDSTGLTSLADESVSTHHTASAFGDEYQYVSQLPGALSRTLHTYQRPARINQAHASLARYRYNEYEDQSKSSSNEGSTRPIFQSSAIFSTPPHGRAPSRGSSAASPRRYHSDWSDPHATDIDVFCQCNCSCVYEEECRRTCELIYGRPSSVSSRGSRNRMSGSEFKMLPASLGGRIRSGGSATPGSEKMRHQQGWKGDARNGMNGKLHLKYASDDGSSKSPHHARSSSQAQHGTTVTMRQPHQRSGKPNGVVAPGVEHRSRKSSHRRDEYSRKDPTGYRMGSSDSRNTSSSRRSGSQSRATGSTDSNQSRGRSGDRRRELERAFSPSVPARNYVVKRSGMPPSAHGVYPPPYKANWEEDEGGDSSYLDGFEMRTSDSGGRSGNTSRQRSHGSQGGRTGSSGVRPGHGRSRHHAEDEGRTERVRKESSTKKSRPEVVRQRREQARGSGRSSGRMQTRQTKQTKRPMLFGMF